MKKLIFRKSSYRQSNNNNNKTWNLSSMLVFSRNSIFAKSSFSLKLDFLKIKFQNRGIFLNSFRQKVFYWKVSTKGVFCHFGRKLGIS